MSLIWSRNYARSATFVCLVLVLAENTDAAGRRYPKRPLCTIASLDLGALPTEAGPAAPTCVIENNFTVNAFNGVSYLADYLQFTGKWFLRAEHVTQSQNAGPWFINHALSRLYKGNSASVRTADKIFVYDYCYVLWWIAYLHTSGARPDVWSPDSMPGGELVSLYHSLIQHPRWQLNNGRDFVFFVPHADFQRGAAETEYTRLVCKEFSQATFVVVERLQRFKCTDFRANQVIVAPYSSNSKYQTCAQPKQHKEGFLYYKGRCTPPQGVQSEGIVIRHKIVNALLNSPGMQIECTDTGSFEPESHTALLESMGRYKFCLCVPGDNHSSGRLVDAMLTGCIPVFVGPPYHALPLVDYVDYASFAVFINFTGEARYTGGIYEGQRIDFVWQADPARPSPLYSAHPDWWVPDILIPNTTVPIDNYEEIAGVLHAIDTDDVLRRQAKLKSFSALFRYLPEYEAGQSATQAIIDAICLS